MLGFSAALILVVWMAAQFSGRQPATVALDVGISFIRITLPLLMILMVQELFSREFDRRYYLNSLTYPRPRHRLLLGRITAITLILFTSLVFMASILAVEVWFIGKGYDQSTPVALDVHYIVTLLFISLDFLALTALATLLAIATPTPSFVLIGTVGFMLIARSYSSIISLIKTNSYVVSNPELYQNSLGILGYLFPDLGALDVRMVSLYGKMQFLPEYWPTLVFSTLFYTLALMAVSFWLLQRKRFN